MPPKARPAALLSDADVPVASSILRKTRNTTKTEETSDVEAPPATMGRKTRNQKRAASKAEDSVTGEISKASSSAPYEENDSQISRVTGSERGKTPARESVHVEEAREIHAMHSNALESSADEAARPEELRETPEMEFEIPETPGAPEQRRISFDEFQPGSSTPRAGMYSQFCRVLQEWQ